MTFLYNIKFAFQKFEFIENTIMTKAKDSQRIFLKNQKIILQI